MQSKPQYWQHRVKHIDCSLHFIVCSDFENWPNQGTTREAAVGEATGLIHCPECGGTRNFLHWKKAVEGFIFDGVPGDAEKVDLAAWNRP